GNHDLAHRAWQDCAANDDRVALILILECFADLFANSSDISQVEIAVNLAWCPNANEGQFRLADRLAWIAGGAQSTSLRSCCDNFTDLCFNDGRLPTVDQIDLCRNRVDSDDFMSIIGEATRRNCTDITQSKDTDSQDAYLYRVTIRVF